jgi:hypothetical protein
MPMTRQEAAAKGSAAAKAKALARGPSRSAQIRSDREMQRIYWVWGAMCKRCYNENDKGYENYGGRGITVCEAWRNSFEAFLSDMGPRPFSGSTLERIDNDSGYSPENCKWVGRQQQNLNKRIYKNSPVGERCVERDRMGFRVRVRREGKIVFSKRFSTIQSAIEARDTMLRERSHASA